MIEESNKGTVVVCYRTMKLTPPFETYPRQKKTKKIQKDVFRKTASISPPVYDTATVYTGPIEPLDSTTIPSKEHRNSRVKKKGKRVIFNLCECNDNGMDENFNGKYRPKTWDSLTEWYGNTDTTKIWGDQEYKIAPLQNNIYQKYPTNIIEGDSDVINDKNEKKKYKRKSKIHKKRGHHYTEQQTYLKPDNPTRLDTSVISLYRKEKIKPEKALIGKPKSKEASPNKLHKIKSLKQKCQDGLCAAAEAKGNKSFFCRCINKNKDHITVLNTEECTDATCKISLNSLNSVVKIKDNFLCLCRKYSQKLFSHKSHKNVCKQGPCYEAAKKLKNKNNNVNMCSVETCGKYIPNEVTVNNVSTGNKNEISTKNKLNNIQNKHIKSKVYAAKQEKKDNKKEDKIIKKRDVIVKTEHETEQTGEPFFEIQVSPRDMCVLNPIEIKKNIIKYGRTEKNEPSCICPSRGRLRPGEVCKTGSCRKAYKNKQMNFNCWCDKKIAECGDGTCDILNMRQTQNKHKNIKQVRFQQARKPLLEVQLDMDKMCVVNPREIEDKIMNNISVDDICSSGVCREAALKSNIPYVCRCISKKLHPEKTECTQDTCFEGSDRKKSKFCLFCTRICSKSENWSLQNRNPRRIRRRSFYEIGRHKLCRGRICTQSDNLYLNKVDLKHLPTCNCQECRSLTRARDKYKITRSNPLTENNTANKRIKDNLTVKHNIIYPPKTKELKKVKDFATASEKTKKLKYYPNSVENIQRSKALKQKRRVVDNIDIDVKNAKERDKLQRQKFIQKLRNRETYERNFIKQLKLRTKLDKQGEKRAAKERMKEIKLMKKKMQEEPLDVNFCTALLLGILKIGFKTIFFVFYLIFAVIKDPKKCYWYVRDRIRDPEGTCNKLRKWFSDAFVIKKLEVAETIRGSDTLTILADHFMDTPFYQSFASKGRTKQDQMVFEQKSKARKRRIRKREQQAIHSCRHMLLTTLRRTPCLWVYHICPNFYPQCLGLLSFMRSFSHILMFLVAFACWTPCILTFELCRACLCCFMCTG